MATPAPEKKRSFRLGRVLLVILLVLILLIGGLLVFRAPLATLAAKTWLESQGIEVQSLEVESLSPDVTWVSDITLGAKGELTIDRLQLQPNVFSAELPLHAVVIHGLALHLDATGDGPPLGSLQAFVDRLFAARDAAQPVGPKNYAAKKETVRLRLPDIAFRESRVVIETPSGPMTADLEGDLSEGDDGALRATAALEIDSELGRLKADLNAGRNADGALQLKAAVAEGSFAWEGFQLGTVTGRLEVSQAPARLPRLEADLDLSDLAYTPSGGQTLQIDRGRLTGNATERQAEVTLTLDGQGEDLDLAVEASSAMSVEGALASIDLQSELRTAGGLAQFLPLPGPAITSGNLVISLKGVAKPAPVAVDGGFGAPGLHEMPARLAGNPFSLSGDIILGDLALADGTSGVSAHLPMTASLQDKALTLALRDDAAVRIETPARDSLAALGVPADLLPLLASGLNLTLKAGGELPFETVATPAWPPREAAITVAAQATSDQGLKLSAGSAGTATLDDRFQLVTYTGSLKARAEADRLSIGGREARGVAVSLPLGVGYDTGGLRLKLTQAGSLAVRQFGAGAPLRLQNPLSLDVEELALETTADATGYRYRLKAREDGAALALTAAEADPLPVTAQTIRASLTGSFAPQSGHDADLDLRLAGFTLPAYDFTAEAAEVTVALDRELRPETSRFSLGPFQAGGAAPLTAPLTLTGDLKRAGGGYDITGELGLSEGRGLADLSGRYNDDGSAAVKAVSRLLSFAPEELQPGDISPLLAGLEEVRGGLTAAAQLVWPRDPAKETGRVTLSDLAFTGQGVEVSGLNLDLTLESLQPLASAPAQKLTIAGLEAGVPVEDIAVTFSLDQTPAPHVTLAEGGFTLAGARWRIEPTTLDPAAESNRVVLATEALDLATFFQLIEIDGLSGDGKLRGRLPIVLAGEDIIVEDGHFAAEGPGRLSIRFQALRSALASGGETVELAAKALEDFRFEELTLDLAKTADNDATVKLSTLGANPEVLDGQPFRFNINLESNLTSVLEALQKGMSLSDDALKRAWRLRE